MSGHRVSSFDEQAWAKDLSSLQTQQKILWTWTRRPAGQQVYDTRFSVSRHPWSYSKDHDDGTPVECHDASTLF